MIAARLAILAALWSPSCCSPTVIRRPVLITPPACLDVLPPDPPATDDDAAWASYHARMEGWAAYAMRACGPKDPDDDGPRIVGPYAD